MNIAKQGKSKDNRLMHYSVGALIKRADRYLLLDRREPPYGFAGPAGHIDEGETEVAALKREVEEESGLQIENYKLVFSEELDWNWCKSAPTHYWYFYTGDASGEIKQNYIETKSIGWYNTDQIKKLKLEPVWGYWFKKLKIL